jgi:uncharacterized protein (DUF362 family)
MEGQNSIIAIKKATEAGLRSEIFDCLKDSGCLKRIEASNSIVIKPNLITDNPAYIQSGANTSMAVLRSLLRIIRDTRPDARIVIGESDVGTKVKGRILSEAYRIMGFHALSEEFDVAVVNFSEEKKVNIPLETGLFFKEIIVPVVAHEADLIIDIPKIKTHKYAKLTCSLKNMFGVIPNPKRVIYHNHLDEAIVDINQAFGRKIIALVDGIVSMEGNGPVYGTPVETNIILSSTDLVALDYVVAKMIGLDPDDIPYIRLAESVGLGQTKNIRTIGGHDLIWTFKKSGTLLYTKFEGWLMRTPLVHILITPGFQKYISRWINPITKFLRGGSFTWYSGGKKGKK